MLVTDTGMHQILTRRHFDAFSAGGLLMPSDFQSMGFGLPAAIAAKLANPTRPVVALVGDGSLLMNVTELATAASLQLPLPVIVFDDRALGQIRYQQDREFGARFSVDLPQVDWAGIAGSVGVACEQVNVPFEGTIRRALAAGGPILLPATVTGTLDGAATRAMAASRRILKTMLGRRISARLARLYRS